MLKTTDELLAEAEKAYAEAVKAYAKAEAYALGFTYVKALAKAEAKKEGQNNAEKDG